MNIGDHENAQGEAGKRGGEAQSQTRSTGQLKYLWLPQKEVGCAVWLKRQLSYISLPVWHLQEELSRLIRSNSWEVPCKARRNHRPGWSTDEMNSNPQKLFPPENRDQGMLFCLQGRSSPRKQPLLTTLLRVLLASAAAAGLRAHVHIWASQGNPRDPNLWPRQVGCLHTGHECHPSSCRGVTCSFLPAQTWACFPLKSLLLDIMAQYANQISEKRLLVNKQTLKLGLASGTLPNQLVCLSASDQGDVSLSRCKVKHLPTSHRSPRAVQLHLSFLFIIFFQGPLSPLLFKH